MTNEQAVQQYRERVKYAVAKLDKCMMPETELLAWSANASQAELKTMVEALYLSYIQLGQEVTSI